MKPSPEPHQSLSHAARHALQDVKQATREFLLQPVKAPASEIVAEVQGRSQELAEGVVRSFDRLEVWAAKYPAKALGAAFGAGVFVALALFRHE